MYTYKKEEPTFTDEEYYFVIYDPNNIQICTVNYVQEAEALISHLNQE